MRYLLCGAAAAALLAGPAAAQAPASGEQAVVSEVVVTARRKEEKVQDVPAAVTGISAEQMKDLGGLKDIKDLSYILPGLSFVDTGNINAENNIRGAGAGTARTAGVDSPIAVLRDGASITGGVIGGRTFTRLDLFDVERVEVTRGPQGALYGVNAVGGVMQAISQRPKSEFGGSLGAVYSPEIERRQIDAILNVPVPAANLGLRLGVQDVQREDGFFRNVYTGKAGDLEEFRAVRLAAEWNPLDSLRVFMVVDQSDELSTSNQVKSVNANNDKSLAATAFGPPDIDGPYAYAANTTNDVNRNVSSFNTQVEWDTPIGKLTSVTLLRKRTTLFSQENDQSAPGYASPPFPAATCATRLCSTLFADETELASQELRLAGDFGDAVTWMLGANLSGKQSDFFTILDGRTTSAANLAPSPTANIASVSKEEELQKGVFGVLSWQATDALTLDGAVRYNNAEKKNDAYTVARQLGTLSCVANYVDPLRVFATNPACVRSRALINDTFENVAPSVSVKYEIADNFRVFGSAAVGYRAGGFNGNSVLDPKIAASYQPEKNVAFEAGAKFELAGAFFTVTAFQNNFNDLLVTVDSIGPDAVSRNYRFNAGEAKTKGVDFEVFGGHRFGPGLGGISYNGAINYLTGEIDSGPYKGQKVEGSPEWTYTAALTYRRPLVKDWRVVTSVSYRGQRGGYTNTTKINNLVKLADFDIVNASVGVDNGRWRMALEARNLFDKTYVTLRDPTRDVYGDPREIRLSLSYAFGSEAR
ncbi:TonB-dependent receptor [Phenylobacterium sp.]|uniref:TonB-dependent receptor n=1 Tax=Phenylobacterium sp. TaxID=1871053 RepID=UPI0035AFAE4B